MKEIYAVGLAGFLALSTGCMSGAVVRTTTAKNGVNCEKLEDNTTLCSIDSDLDGKNDYFKKLTHNDYGGLVKREHFKG